MTRIKHIGLCSLLGVAVQSLCYADVTKLSPDDRKVLQDSSRFHDVHSTSDLPPTIVTLCGGKIAEPGGSGMQPILLSIQLSLANA